MWKSTGHGGAVQTSLRRMSQSPSGCWSGQFRARQSSPALPAPLPLSPGASDFLQQTCGDSGAMDAGMVGGVKRSLESNQVVIASFPHPNNPMYLVWAAKAKAPRLHDGTTQTAASERGCRRLYLLPHVNLPPTSPQPPSYATATTIGRSSKQCPGLCFDFVESECSQASLL
jgi:hypothetical protein